MRMLVTGSSGLVGSETCSYFEREGYEILGLDNNMRRFFFGEQGDTAWNLERMKKKLKSFNHIDMDIRDFDSLENIFRQYHFDAIVHCAAQPSHDKAKDIPLIDFGVNATGTLNLLECTRKYCPDAVFIHLSTNKVYGDSPNDIPMKELTTRYDYANPEDWQGIDESCRIDRCLHSLFGASKLAGDIMAQEYGRYFGIKIGVFRGGCLTGPQHSGVQLHGFLSYLVKACLRGIPYTVFGYKGKQVRDNIHCHDIVHVFHEFIRAPRCGEVYNLGGGRNNSISVLEAIEKVEQLSGKKLQQSYSEKNRIGDHICYISNLAKLKNQFPAWDIEIGIDEILREMVDFEASMIK